MCKREQSEVSSVSAVLPHVACTIKVQCQIQTIGKGNSSASPNRSPISQISIMVSHPCKGLLTESGEKYVTDRQKRVLVRNKVRPWGN